MQGGIYSHCSPFNFGKNVKKTIANVVSVVIEIERKSNKVTVDQGYRTPGQSQEIAHALSEYFFKISCVARQLFPETLPCL